MKLIPIILLSIALVVQQTTINNLRKSRDRAMKQTEEALNTTEQIQGSYNVLWRNYTNIIDAVKFHMKRDHGTIL